MRWQKDGCFSGEWKAQIDPYEHYMVEPVYTDHWGGRPAQTRRGAQPKPVKTCDYKSEFRLWTHNGSGSHQLRIAYLGKYPSVAAAKEAAERHYEKRALEVLVAA